MMRRAGVFDSVRIGLPSYYQTPTRLFALATASGLLVNIVGWQPPSSNSPVKTSFSTER